MINKIYLSGPSGTGKTTLAVELAKRLHLPYITTSGSVLWKKYGITKHSDILKLSQEKPSVGFQYQFDLLKHRYDTLSTYVDGFVTDRSPVDNIAYYLIQNSAFLSNCTTTDYIKFAAGTMNDLSTEKGDSMIIMVGIPKSVDFKIEDNKHRILNIYFQELVELVMRNTMDKYFYDFSNMFINYWDFETRVAEVINNIDKINIKATI